MEFQYQDVNQGFTSPDFNFNFEPGGQVAPRYNAPPPPNSVENLTTEYILKQQQLADAVRNQHKIDNIYERVMNEAPRRDVEVLPPETPGEFFDPNRTRMKNVTPVDQAQEISELLERQVKRPATTPTSAQPPAVPNYKTIPLTDPLATPPTYTPRTPVRGPNPTPTAKPAGLPASAGRFAVPAVAAIADFGFRVVAGQPPAKAAFGAAGSAAGSAAGAALGAGAGPVGMFVGGIIGGFVGGAIADAIYDAAAPPSAVPGTDPYTAQPPFYGGQEPVLYRWNFSTRRNPRADYLGNLGFTTVGPLSNFKVVRLLNTDFTINPPASNWQAQFTNGEGAIITGSAVGDYDPADLPFLVVARVDNQPDPRNPPAPAPPPDPRPYQFQSGGEAGLAPPTGTPAPPPAPTGYAPGGTTPKGTPRGDGSNWVPPPFPAPKKDPNPNTTPSGLGGNFPGSSPAPAPNPNPQPPQPFNFKLVGPPGSTSPGGSGVPTPQAPPGAVPGGFPQPIPQPSPPDGNKNIPPSTPPGTGNPNTPPAPTTPTGSSIGGDICNTSCMRNLTQKAKDNEISWLPLPVPVVSCVLEDGRWQPKTEIQLITILATPNGNDSVGTYIKFQELAKVNSELCLAKNKDDITPATAILTLPERYQIPVDGHIPQMIYVFREIKVDGTWGERMYPMTVPHPKSDKPPETRPLPDYKKGSWEMILTLKNNTKIFINAVSMAECSRMVELVKPLIDPAFLEGSFEKIGQRKGQQLLEINVRIFKVDYFEKGTKNSKPTWIKYFRN